MVKSFSLAKDLTSRLVIRIGDLPPLQIRSRNSNADLDYELPFGLLHLHPKLLSSFTCGCCFGKDPRLNSRLLWRCLQLALFRFRFPILRLKLVAQALVVCVVVFHPHGLGFVSTNPLCSPFRNTRKLISQEVRLKRELIKIPSKSLRVSVYYLREQLR